jgi:hypothetical protein
MASSTARNIFFSHGVSKLERRIANPPRRVVPRPFEREAEVVIKYQLPLSLLHACVYVLAFPVLIACSLLTDTHAQYHIRVYIIRVILYPRLLTPYT